MRRELAERLGSVAALLLFCIFAVSAFAVLLFGADIYDSVDAMNRDSREERMCLSYVWTKIKNSDEAGRVYMGEIGGVPALCIEEDLSGRVFLTLIYHYNGSVRELFFEAGYEYPPGSGAEIMKCGPLDFAELENGLIKATTGGESILIQRRAAI